MKKILLVKLFVLASFAVLADRFEEIDVSGQQNVDLSEVDSSLVWLRQDYTGPISGYCGLVLNSSLPMATILEKLEMDRQPSELSTNSASFTLTPYQYVDRVKLKVISGESLESTLKQLGASLTVSSVRCDSQSDP